MQEVIRRNPQKVDEQRQQLIAADASHKTSLCYLKCLVRITFRGRKEHKMLTLFHIHFVSTLVAGRRYATFCSAALP